MTRPTNRPRRALLGAAAVLAAVLRIPSAPSADAYAFGPPKGATATAAAAGFPSRSPPSELWRGSAASSSSSYCVLRMAEGEEVSSTEKSEEDSEGQQQRLGLDEYASAVAANVLGGGELGARGEYYVALQFGLLLCIALGGIPFGVGPALSFVVGPSLLFGGLAVVYLAAIELGSTMLSPWPSPPRTSEEEGGLLARGGMYSYVRHPMYAGLLAGMAGLSVVTDSANRLLLTGALAVALHFKAEYEEERMTGAFPDYRDYMEEVKGRFLPKGLTEKVSDFVKNVVE